MADPTKPTIDYSYTGFQQEQQDFPFPGHQLDNDLAKIANALGVTIDALKDIRRPDGRLQNRIVTQDSLSDELSIGIEKPEEWKPGTNYVSGNTVYFDNVVYRAKEAHESAATFAEDLAAGLWEEIVNFKDVAAETLANAQAAEASAGAAASSAFAAFDSASAAATSAGNASDSADLSQAWATGTNPDGLGSLSAREEADRAEKWADEDEDVPVDESPDRFSSKHWAAKAADLVGSVIGDTDVHLIRRRFVATAAQTVFAGNDANGISLAYTPGNEIVLLNGVQLVRGQDYTGTDGATITLTEGAIAGSAFVVLTFVPINVADAYTKGEVDGFVATLEAADIAGYRLKGAPVVFTASGTYTKPSDVRAVVVEVQGAGGGGGGATSSDSTARAGGGGGAGAYAKHFIASPSSTYTVTVGAEGTGGAAGNNAGSAGGLSSFGSVVSCPGGIGGQLSGTSTADQNIVGMSTGQSAPTGGNIVSRRGWRGWGALKLSSTSRQSGAGANSIFGAGAASSQSNSSGAASNGNAAQGIGAGGSGGISSTTTDASGGNGGAGLVIVWEYI